MAPKFLPFEEVEELATIHQLAVMLNLDPKLSGSQYRCACPVHGGDHRTLCISPQVKSKRGSLGVFFCQADKTGRRPHRPCGSLYGARPARRRVLHRSAVRHGNGEQ